jgi:hypothetical protein
VTTAEMPQHMRALEAANQIRLKGAEFRREIRSESKAAGLAILADALEAPERPRYLKSMRLNDFLGSPHRVGRYKVSDVLWKARIDASLVRTVGELCKPDRDRLARVLREMAGR